MFALGPITADVTAGPNGSANVEAGGSIQSTVTSGQDITISSMGAISGTATGAGVVTITSGGDESDTVTGGTLGVNYSVPVVDVLAWGTITGTLTAVWR